MKKFAKWLVTALVVTCICCLTIGLTACGEKAKTVKSVEVNSNGELVAIYDNEEKVTLGKLSNVRSAEEKDGKLVITLVDGKTIEVPTKIDVPEQVKSVKSIASANGVLTITYTDGTTETVKVADKAVKSVAVKDGKLVVTLFDGTTEEVPLPSEKAVKDVTVVDGKIKVTYTDGTEEIVCKHENAIYHSLKHHSVNEAGELVEGYGIKLCPDCGATITVKEGHNLKETVVEPTCTSDGYTAVKCVDGDGVKGCGYEEAHDPDKDVPKLPHDYGDPVKVKDEGCEADYTTLKICKNCNHAEPTVVPAAGHEIEVDYDTLRKPDYDQAGSVTVKCKKCTYKTVLTLPARNNSAYVTAPVGEKKDCTELGEVAYSITLKAGEKILVDVEVKFSYAGVAGKHVFCGKSFVKDDKLILTQEEFDAKLAEGKIKLINGSKFTCDEQVQAQAIVDCENCTTEAITIFVAKDHEEDTTVDRTNVVPATCQEEGHYDYKCKGCGQTFRGTLEKVGHNYTKDVKVTPAGDGKYNYTAVCSECGDMLTIPNIEIINEIKADCQHEGKLIYKLNGEEKEFKTGDKTDHTLAIINGKNILVKPDSKLPYSEYKDYIKKILNGDMPEDANCEDAVNCLYECKVCHDDSNTVWLLGDHVIPKDETTGEPILTHHEPDCGVEGYDEYVCAKCHKPQQINKVDALVHDYEYEFDGDKTLTGTCKHNPAHKTEVVCDKVDVKTVKATCKEEGSKTYTCWKNGEVIDTKVQVLPVSTIHSHKVNGEDVPVEGLLKITPEEYAKNGGWLKILNGNEKFLCVESKKGTVEAIYDCSVCGESYTVFVYADHVIDSTKENNSKPATCTEAGKDDYWCARCGDHIERETIEPTGHDYNIVLKYEDDGKVYAYESCKNCTVSDKVETTIELTGTPIRKTPATCMATGLEVYKVTYKGHEYEVEKVIPKTTDHQTGNNPEITWTVKGKNGDVEGTWSYKGKYCDSCDEIIYTEDPVFTPDTPAEDTTNA